MQIEEAAAPPESGGRSFRDVWQVPVLLLGFGLFVVGIWSMMPSEKTNDYVGALDEIATYQRAGNLEEARNRIEVIDEFMSAAPPLLVSRFRMINGDQIYLEQLKNNWTDQRNHMKVVELYRNARDGGQTLGNTQIRRWAETLVALGNNEAALAKLDDLQGNQSDTRIRIVREIIERQLTDQPTLKLADIEDLITRYLKEVMNEPDPQLRREAEIWAIALKGRLLLEEEQPDNLISFLNVKYAKMQAANDDDLAPIRVLFGKSYQSVGRLDDAERWYLEAQKNIGNRRDDPLNADIYVGLGRIELSRADSTQSPAVARALNYFNYAERNYPGTEPYAEALVGRADCRGRLGHHDEARADFQKAVQLLGEQQHTKETTLDYLVETAIAHHGMAFDKQDYRLALSYLQALRPLFDEQMPTKVLAKFAVTHGAIGEQETQSITKAIDLGERVDDDIAQAFRAAKIEAAVHFERSGDYYLQYAKAVTVPDAKARADTLWNAAVQYDKARRWEKSIKVYNEFYETNESDPRRLEAQRRLGLAYMANNDFKAAAGLFESLVESSPRSPQTYAALVPLARTYRATKGDEEAERILRYVVTDHPAITPESQHFRDALIELGDLYYKQKQFESAIEILDQAVKRYGDEKLVSATLKYKLGDSYRKSVLQIDKTLEDPMAESKRSALLAQRAEWLNRGQILFGHVIDDLKQRGEKLMTELEKVYYRNAYFYRADCAYDLGRFEEAIALYDAAAKAWEKHPSSLVAIVQIVNANCELGRIQQARIANEKARHFLKRMPEEAFNDPTLPMTRKHWEEWLRWSNELNLFGSSASATP